MFRANKQIGPYTLIRPLGKGGFGEVWLAERQTKYVTTKVAVKLPLHEHVDHEAIKQEASIWEHASGHPNVLPIIDADEYDGQVVIVSEFAPDGSLGDLLVGRGGALPAEQALKMAIGIVSGLEFLHSRNVIHRDLKPANVLLQGETPRLADFGLSRVIKTDSVSLITAGTPSYMAPEAFNRKRNNLTDIWSAGIILYEMTAGQLPFTGQDITDLMSAIVLHEPEAFPISVPSDVRQVILKAIAKSPPERYQTATEMNNDLHKLLHRRSVDPAWESTNRFDNTTLKIPTTSGGRDVKKTIAILPFQNLSGDRDSQFYEFSLADAVTTELARLNSLVVRPSSAIAKYQGTQIDPREAGRQLFVSSVLSAGFIHSGSRVRVTAQLLDVVTGDIIWSDRIDSDASDIFELQDAITKRIVSGLELEVSLGETEALHRRPTQNKEAYEAYLRGRDQLARFMFRTLSENDCDEAIESFRLASDLDERFALAWSGLGACFANKTMKGIGGIEDYDRAEIALKKALSLDPNIVESRVLTCLIHLRRGEKQAARSELARLSSQFPNEAALYFIKGVMHRLDGQYENSLMSYDKLERLDPSAVISACWNRSRIYSLRGDHDQAMKELDRGAVLEPNHPVTKVFRAYALYHAGEVEDAIRMMEELLVESPHLNGLRPLLAVMLAKQKKATDAQRNLAGDALKMSDFDCDVAFWIASAYSLLGEKDKGLEWLERSIKLGLEDRALFENDTDLDALRGGHRFDELMRVLSVL